MRDPELVKKSAELREAHYDGSVKRLAESAGITIEQARERLPKPPADSGSDVRYLADDYALEAKGEFIAVRDLVARGHEFHGCAMPDPIEGAAYGTSTAKFYFDELNGGIIHSFAHGRKTTYILLDFAPCEYIQVFPPPEQAIYSAGEPLPLEVFPHMGRIGPKGTIPNTRALLNSYGIVARYDVIGKRLILTVPGHSGTDDNFDSSALAHVISLANLNGIPTGNLPHFIAAIADENPVNPVADWILSKPWDGIDRLPLLYATLTTRDGFPVALKETLLLRWLLSAVAAVFMHTGFKARGVLVLQGPQSIGKTTWFIMLIDDPLLRDKVLLIDHHLDASNKDSKLVALSHWLVEIGELDSSFKRDVSRLKGFVTNLRDKIRRPYGLREAEYQRRTVFCASVNHGDYLVDETGNSRWWSLPVTAVNYQHGIPMQQLWAQVATIYQAGVQWWLTREEEHLLEQQNQKHRSVSAIRDAIDSKLKWDAPKSEWKLLTATKVLEMVGYKQPGNPQMRECGAVLRERLGEPTQSQGNTRWMVPPAQLWGDEE